LHRGAAEEQAFRGAGEESEEKFKEIQRKGFEEKGYQMRILLVIFNY
jgi:hypothetical protein